MIARVRARVPAARARGREIQDTARAALGRGAIGIVDADEVDLSNLQRHLVTYVPGQGPCYRCVFHDMPPKDAVPTCKQAGVIGCLEALEAIKYICGIGGGSFSAAACSRSTR